MPLFHLFIAAVSVLAADSHPQTYVLCKLRGDVRTIRIHVDANGCRAVYTKAGVDKPVGSGRNKGSCQDFLNNIRINLEKSNWKCRDVASATVTEGGK